MPVPPPHNINWWYLMILHAPVKTIIKYNKLSTMSTSTDFVELAETIAFHIHSQNHNVRKMYEKYRKKKQCNKPVCLTSILL